MFLPPFTLYGLIGCPHCENAERFLRVRSIPFLLVIANDDPIADEGIKANNGGTAEYPMLVSRISKEIKKGFDELEYERIAKTFFSLASPSTGSVFSGQQLNNGEAAATTPTHPAGAN